jgi:hypothetical protein
MPIPELLLSRRGPSGAAVSAPPTLAPDQIMFRVKGYTSRHLRQEFPELLKLPSMWTRSYFCSTAARCPAPPSNATSTSKVRSSDRRSALLPQPVALRAIRFIPPLKERAFSEFSVRDARTHALAPA